MQKKFVNRCWSVLAIMKKFSVRFEDGEHAQRNYFNIEIRTAAVAAGVSTEWKKTHKIIILPGSWSLTHLTDSLLLRIKWNIFMRKANTVFHSISKIWNDLATHLINWIFPNDVKYESICVYFTQWIWSRYDELEWIHHQK